MSKKQKTEKYQMPLILNQILEAHPDEDIKKTEEQFDEAIIGVCTDFNAPVRLIYSVKKYIELLAKEMDGELDEDEIANGVTLEQKNHELAIEFFDFNISGAYVEGHPVWCHDNF